MSNLGTLRTCKRPGLQPCKVCKTPFAVGDLWYAQLDGLARVCVTCAGPIIAEIMERDDARRAADSAERLEHRRAVTVAKRQGSVL